MRLLRRCTPRNGKNNNHNEEEKITCNEKERGNHCNDKKNTQAVQKKCERKVIQ